MRSLDAVVELFGLATQDMKWGAALPTKRSLERIHETLGVRIPDAYVQVAAACPNYGAYLNGIGEDYDHGVHMLRLTQWFRSASVPPLPSHYVLLSHGHDGDCDCWDTREVEASGEHPIVHVSLETGDCDAPSQVQIKAFDMQVLPTICGALQFITPKGCAIQVAIRQGRYGPPN